MLRVWAVCVGALCLTTASSQPVSCQEEEQCSVGYYCETDVHVCKECLSCQDLKREPPSTPKDCIKSIIDCGPCIKGLVVDRHGDLNSACVDAMQPEGTPNYVWVLIGTCMIIFLAVMVGIIVYLSLNSGIFDLFKIGGNCQGGTVSTNIRAETRASAPEAPPPYAPPQYRDIPYSSVRNTESPCPPQHEAGNAYETHLEEEGPFIEKSERRPTGARESSANQAARVYNPPRYEQQDLPPSPETPIVTELDDNLPIHDEETVESPWTPSGPANGDLNAIASAASPANAAGAEGAPVSLPTLLAAARDSSLIEHTPPKQMCIRPVSSSSNRNRDSNPGGGDSQSNFSSSQNGSPYNIITQITNVIQLNQST